MIDLKFIGNRIRELRIERGLTQSEFAENLCISFQAVSNWERGLSMPDISKIPELAELFEVTIDELLCNESSLVASVAKGEAEKYLEENEVTAEELTDAAPILKPKQVDEIFEKTKVNSVDEILGLLPFLETDVIDRIMLKAVSEGNDEEIAVIAPFVSKDCLEKSADELYSKKGVCGLTGILPFTSEYKLNEIAEIEYGKNGLKQFEIIAPFLDAEHLNNLAKKAIEKDGIKAISNIAPFLSRELLAEYMKEKYL